MRVGEDDEATIAPWLNKRLCDACHRAVFTNGVKKDAQNNNDPVA